MSYGITELGQQWLTHWGRVTHICVGKLTITGSDNGLSPGRRQAIIWTNAGILLIGPLGTNFGEISIRIQTLSFKKMHLKMSSAGYRSDYIWPDEGHSISYPHRRAIECLLWVSCRKFIMFKRGLMQVIETYSLGFISPKVIIRVVYKLYNNQKLSSHYF